MEPFEDENIPLYTVGQVAEMLSLKQAFLRRIDDLRVVSPSRSAGRQRRYTRIEIRVIQQVASMADEGMTLPAIRRSIELEQRLSEVVRQRDDLAARLSESSAERMRLGRQLNLLLRRAARKQQAVGWGPGGYTIRQRASQPETSPNMISPTATITSSHGPAGVAASARSDQSTPLA